MMRKLCLASIYTFVHNELTDPMQAGPLRHLKVTWKRKTIHMNSITTVWSATDIWIHASWVFPMSIQQSESHTSSHSHAMMKQVTNQWSAVKTQRHVFHNTLWDKSLSCLLHKTAEMVCNETYFWCQKLIIGRTCVSISHITNSIYLTNHPWSQTTKYL